MNKRMVEARLLERIVW